MSVSGHSLSKDVCKVVVNVNVLSLLCTLIIDLIECNLNSTCIIFMKRNKSRGDFDTEFFEKPNKPNDFRICRRYIMIFSRY